MLGAFNAPLAEEFWRAVATNGAFNLHVLCYHGQNAHHIVEGIFKATPGPFARPPTGSSHARHSLHQGRFVVLRRRFLKHP